MQQSISNSAHVDSIIQELREVYSYEELRGLDLESLHNKERELENRFTMAKAEFPPRESVMRGGLRKYVIGDNKEPLTPEEERRLDLAKQELRHNIQKARAHRKNKQRRHQRALTKLRAEFLGECAKILESLSKLFPW
jgi:hypothetical protein